MTDNVVELSQGTPQEPGRGTVVAPDPATAAPQPAFMGAVDQPGIGDRQFMDDLTQLKSLRSYMIRQAKSAQAGTIELGNLNLLHFDERGRSPTFFEWSELEHKSNDLYQHLSEADRRRFLYGQIPRFVIRTAGALGCVALGALATTVIMTHLLGDQPVSFVFMAFLTWAAALGGVGSIAFIGMNALAVQEDATFDITNEKLLGLRVMLGALFAVILTLPFGYGAFKVFIWDLLTQRSETELITALATKSLLLLLPFILGFSTTLVIMILNQFVEAIQTFFGRRGSPPSAGRAG